MKPIPIVTVALFGVLVQPAVADDLSAAAEPIERGRYLVKVSGCNDCHTPGYMERSGEVSEAEWLTGSEVGFQGPWGTTYATNLRRYVAEMSEDQWLEKLHQPMRPPMPWFNVKAMTDDDLRAIYRYIDRLGAAGEPAPAAVAPGVAVATPYLEFVPKRSPTLAER